MPKASGSASAAAATVAVGAVAVDAQLFKTTRDARVALYKMKIVVADATRAREQMKLDYRKAAMAKCIYAAFARRGTNASFTLATRAGTVNSDVCAALAAIPVCTDDWHFTRTPKSVTIFVMTCPE